MKHVYWKLYRNSPALLKPILVKNNIPENVIEYIFEHFKIYNHATKIFIFYTKYDNNISEDWSVFINELQEEYKDFIYQGALNSNLRKLKLIQINKIANY